MKYIIKIFDCAGNEMPEFEHMIECSEYETAKNVAMVWEADCYDEDECVDWYEIFEIGT